MDQREDVVVAHHDLLDPMKPRCLLDLRQGSLNKALLFRVNSGNNVGREELRYDLANHGPNIPRESTALRVQHQVDQTRRAGCDSHYLGFECASHMDAGDWVIVLERP